MAKSKGIFLKENEDISNFFFGIFFSRASHSDVLSMFVDIDFRKRAGEYPDAPPVATLKYETCFSLH